MMFANIFVLCMKSRTRQVCETHECIPMGTCIEILRQLKRVADVSAMACRENILGNSLDQYMTELVRKVPQTGLYVKGTPLWICEVQCKQTNHLELLNKITTNKSGLRNALDF